MDFSSINPLGVVLATLAAFAFNFVWFGPIGVFWTWWEAIGRSRDEQPGAGMNMGVVFGSTVGSLVVEANPSQLKRVEALQARGRKEEERRRREAMSLAEKLGSLTVTMPVRVGEGGRLFGTVTNADVVAALKAQHGHELDRRTVEIAEASKALTNAAEIGRAHV